MRWNIHCLSIQFISQVPALCADIFSEEDWLIWSNVILCENVRLFVYICVFVCVPSESWRRLGQINAYINCQRPSHACFARIGSVDTSTFLAAFCSSNTGRVKALTKPIELSDRGAPVLYRMCVCVRVCLRWTKTSYFDEFSVPSCGFVLMRVVPLSVKYKGDSSTDVCVWFELCAAKCSLHLKY